MTTDNIKHIKNDLNIVNKRIIKKNAFLRILFNFKIILFFISACILADIIFTLAPIIKIIIVSLVTLYSIYIFCFNILIPFLKINSFFFKPNYYELAKITGSRYSNLKDKLLNALQLHESNSINGFSSELSLQAIKEVYNQTRRIDFKKVISFNEVRGKIKILVYLILIFVLPIVSISSVGSSFQHLINYNTDYTIKLNYSVNVNPGDAKVTKGDDINVSAIFSGLAPKSVKLYYKTDAQVEFNSSQILSSSKLFSYEFKSVDSDIEYFFEINKDRTSIYKLTTLNPPITKSIRITIISPKYSRIKPIEQIENGNITALKGSRVKYEITSTKTLHKATMSLNSSEEIVFDVNDFSGSTELIINKNDYYKINLLDIDSISNVDPVEYEISTIEDIYPDIKLNFPTKDIKLPANDNISLDINISDDYGFSKLLLIYQNLNTESSGTMPIVINKKNTDQNIFFNWDLFPLQLNENDILSFHLQIFDNDIISGPKSSLSKSIQITVPSLNELLAESNSFNNSFEKELKTTMEEAQNLKKEFEKLSDKLKKDDKKISWEEKQNVESVLEKYQKLKKNVSQLNDAVSEFKKELSQNNILSPETLQKYEELQKLFEDLDDPKIREAFNKLQEMMKSLDRDQIQQSVENLKLNEEMLKASIERTLKLLKRIQVEQKLDELVKRAEDLSRKESDILSETKKINKTKTDKFNRLAQKQNKISEDLEKYNSALNDLDKLLDDLKDTSKKDFEEFKKNFNQQENNDKSNAIEELLKMMNKPQSIKNQKQLAQNFESLQAQSKNLKDAMSKQDKYKSLSKMMKLTNNLLDLSQNQEKLLKNTQQLKSDSRSLIHEAEEQNKIKQDLNKLNKSLSELAQRTFAITPELGISLGNANSKMQKAINESLEQHQASTAKAQKGAMSYLNESANLLKNAMNNMMNGNSGGGMMSLMQQLQEMSQQQMSLNQITKMMQQESALQKQLSQMGKLSQQQKLIRKSLEQLNKEAILSGKSKSLSANLEQILNEMQEVITKMQTEAIDKDLIDTQDKILSKLLDAQRSMNERDYEQRRESSTGKTFTLNSPNEIFLNSEKVEDLLLDELKRAVEQGYSRDYIELIREYFKEIQNKSSK